MSYILEALGKAEKTRKQEHLAELASDLYRPKQQSTTSSWIRKLLWLLLPVVFFTLGYFARPYLDRVQVNVKEVSLSENTVTPAAVAAKPIPKLITSTADSEGVLETRESTPVPTATEPDMNVAAQKVNHVVSVISFSDTPAERFAMVNGVIIKEGDTLGSGEQVLQIDRTSVLLDKQGESFVLTLN